MSKDVSSIGSIFLGLQGTPSCVNLICQPDKWSQMNRVGCAGEGEIRAVEIMASVNITCISRHIGYQRKVKQKLMFQHYSY